MSDRDLVIILSCIIGFLLILTLIGIIYLLWKHYAKADKVIDLRKSDSTVGLKKKDKELES